MNIEDLTLKQLREIAAIAGRMADLSVVAEPHPHPHPVLPSVFAEKHVLIRTRSAGVHVGALVRKDGMNVLLRDARRIWKWEGAFTLSEVATMGIKEAGSRMSCTVGYIELTEVIEIIPTTEAARKTFDACHE